jgi:hypothetical protein
MDIRVGRFWRGFPACTPEPNLLASKALSMVKFCERLEVRLWYIPSRVSLCASKRDTKRRSDFFLNRKIPPGHLIHSIDQEIKKHFSNPVFRGT